MKKVKLVIYFNGTYRVLITKDVDAQGFKDAWVEDVVNKYLSVRGEIDGIENNIVTLTFDREIIDMIEIMELR